MAGRPAGRRPLAGEHSRAILEELDYAPDRVAELIAEGVVFERSQAGE